ncbi:hypothetical protein AKJ65_03220 [candidate division MSBL1 archaeon SCGC-AAA259E19]|uniref:Core-binding (CB) domain-containing protein n=1 Tax=candidate division MSBL1 archaeon SCGC-AAA259E19 TaxID=1698264 RepID=A0A133UKX9_9EURY|nr:hypothetical protein AKJ65_03220 [candidate division MSBL1 archaeon SCGC-AAA259E19]
MVLDLETFETEAELELSPKTKELYTESLEDFDDWLKEKGDQENKVEMVKEYRRHLLKGRELSKSSISRHISAIKAYFRLVEDKTVKVRLPRVERKSLVEGRDYPAPKDVQKVVRMTEVSRDRAIIATGFSTGARKMEICSLNRSDLDLPHVVISREKTGGSRKGTPEGSMMRR